MSSDFQVLFSRTNSLENPRTSIQRTSMNSPHLKAIHLSHGWNSLKSTFLYSMHFSKNSSFKLIYFSFSRFYFYFLFFFIHPRTGPGGQRWTICSKWRKQIPNPVLKSQAGFFHQCTETNFNSFWYTHTLLFLFFWLKFVIQEFNRTNTHHIQLSKYVKCGNI